jgi:hypothetical protein
MLLLLFDIVVCSYCFVALCETSFMIIIFKDYPHSALQLYVMKRAAQGERKREKEKKPLSPLSLLSHCHSFLAQVCLFIPSLLLLLLLAVVGGNCS